jgi:hypothetical protein
VSFSPPEKRLKNQEKRDGHFPFRRFLGYGISLALLFGGNERTRRGARSFSGWFL